MFFQNSLVLGALPKSFALFEDNPDLWIGVSKGGDSLQAHETGWAVRGWMSVARSY